MKKYEPKFCKSVSEIAKQIVALANTSKKPVQISFNGVILTANPDDKPETIVTFFQNEMKRRLDEYVNSPEYKEQQRRAKEAQRRQDLLLKEALSTAPEKMSFKDENGWKEFVKSNPDSYGSGVVRFAERWARLMEDKITKGDTVAGCAEETSHIADNEGITGFMYGCAVSILSQVWKYGEDLRRWHNLETQIGDEGEKANKSGGILNPALICVGKK